MLPRCVDIWQAAFGAEASPKEQLHSELCHKRHLAAPTGDEIWTSAVGVMGSPEMPCLGVLIKEPALGDAVYLFKSVHYKCRVDFNYCYYYFENLLKRGIAGGKERRCTGPLASPPLVGFRKPLLTVPKARCQVAECDPPWRWISGRCRGQLVEGRQQQMGRTVGR